MVLERHRMGKLRRQQMAANFQRQTALRRDAGMTMIELMIAGVVLIVGFLGITVLITTAIAGNARNRNDSSGTMLAQMVMEQISSALKNSGTTRSVTDCAGNNFTISAVGSSGGSGASLSGSTIDFTAAQVTNYSMNYVVCNATGRRATYDVRWNVQTLATGPTLVTVAARPRGASTDLKRFAIPVSLRTMMGN
jgi:Tfp pilus assembly protein PilV